MQKKQLFTITTLLLLCASALGTTPKDKVKPAIEQKAEFFEAADVSVTGGPFKEATERDKKYLLSLPVDRLLTNFRTTAGIPTDAKPFGGWQDPKNPLRGAFVGHYITACARIYANTGDKEMKDRVDQLIAGLAECQEKFGDGYVGEFPKDGFEEFEKTGKAPKGIWVPWWSQHALYAGLEDAYNYAGSEKALDVMKRSGDWIKSGLDKVTDAQVQNMLNTEQGGMNEILADLYALTGNKDYLTLAERFCHQAILKPLAEGRDDLTNKHANTQVPKVVGAARLYELTGKEEYKKMASYFWHEVVEKRSYATGGNSIDEHFKKLGTEPLGAHTAETCNVHNMLRLTRLVATWDPSDSSYGDYYERALLNQILASQDPDTGMMLYFLSTKPGHFKVYNTPENSFWCCTATGVENPPRYGEGVYMHGKDTLWINLFMQTELNWKDAGVRLRQDTKFPEETQTKLTILESKDTAFTMNIRVPSWAAGPVVAKVNGKEEFKGEKKGWVAINRKWKKGDVVEVSLPMNLHLYRKCDDPKSVAVLYGPTLLAGALGTDKMPKSDQAKAQWDLDSTPVPMTVPVLVADANNLDSWIKPVAGKPLTFRTKDAGRPNDVDLVPFYTIAHQRYSLYWDMMNADEWKAQEAERAAKTAQSNTANAAIVDSIQPGEQQPDIDHKIQSEKSNTGVSNDISWRDARDGGWFSYDVKVLADQPMKLRCTYWGSDAGNRDFEILIDGKKIGEQKLENNNPDKFFDVDYPIPAELTKDKTKVTVKFQAHSGKVAGGLFKVSVVK
ncbi:TPA: glycosyl hydrolase [Candidatus Sumerlaeota bacterium]|jgi:uncharacterized protein|nr:glycosyl hydrolase [Candidatus Sumerlaeota bacterium]